MPLIFRCDVCTKEKYADFAGAEIQVPEDWCVVSRHVLCSSMCKEKVAVALFPYTQPQDSPRVRIRTEYPTITPWILSCCQHVSNLDEVLQYLDAHQVRDPIRPTPEHLRMICRRLVAKGRLLPSVHAEVLHYQTVPELSLLEIKYIEDLLTPLFAKNPEGLFPWEMNEGLQLPSLAMVLQTLFYLLRVGTVREQRELPPRVFAWNSDTIPFHSWLFVNHYNFQRPSR